MIFSCSYKIYVNLPCHTLHYVHVMFRLILLLISILPCSKTFSRMILKRNLHFSVQSHLEVSDLVKLSHFEPPKKGVLRFKSFYETYQKPSCPQGHCYIYLSVRKCVYVCECVCVSTKWWCKKRPRLTNQAQCMHSILSSADDDVHRSYQEQGLGHISTIPKPLPFLPNFFRIATLSLLLMSLISKSTHSCRECDGKFFFSVNLETRFYRYL